MQLLLEKGKRNVGEDLLKREVVSKGGEEQMEHLEVRQGCTISVKFLLPE